MERKLSILMVAAELHPLAKVGGLADVMGALPKAIEKQGHRVSIALPYYGTVRQKDISTHPVKGLNAFDVALGDRAFPARVRSTRLPGSKVEVFLIGNEDLLGRGGIYNDPGSGRPYEDNADRFVFFSRAVTRMLKSMNWYPDIIHCHDHQTGFIPAWVATTSLENVYPESLRTVFTIHNLAYQGVYPREIGYRAGFGEAMLKPMGGIEFHGDVNMMKAAVTFADTITTVSPTYAKEIQTPEYGYGLEEVLRSRSEHLVGILNGADYSVWDPKKDKLIPARFDHKKPDGKQKCRQKLVERLGLKIGEETPLIGIISRLVAQKGFDILTEVFDRVMGLDVGFVILGLGEKQYHDKLAAMAERYTGKVSLNLAFDEELAHWIEAGCDMFLMPSKYEPCGLNQMYSMKYGTIPVVRSTGGLADTVTDFAESSDSTGFVFKEYTGEALLGAVERAREAFSAKDTWGQLIQRAMNRDFSWDRSAEAYESLYIATLGRRRVVTTS
jgi:starch synthase